MLTPNTAAAFRRFDHLRPRAIAAACLALAAGFTNLGCSGSDDTTDPEIVGEATDTPISANADHGESQSVEEATAPNAAQLDYMASLDPDVAKKVLAPVSNPVIYTLTTADNHRITWRESEYGVFQVKEIGKTPLLMWKVQDANEGTAVGTFAIMNPGAPVPDELVALDARVEEMRTVYSDLSALKDKRVQPQREALDIATDGVAQTLGSAMTVNEFSDWCHSWAAGASRLIAHSPVYEKDKILRRDLTLAFSYGASFRGTIRYQMKKKTWGTWEVQEDDLAKGEVWGDMNSGFFDFDYESAIYPEGNDKGGHCLIYRD